MRPYKYNRREVTRALAMLPVTACLPKCLRPEIEEAAQKAKGSLGDALAVWHMGDATGQGLHGGRITTHGSVTLGVSMPEDERIPSLRCGGDGKFAQIRGGYLRADMGGMDLSGAREMTLCMRVRGIGEQNKILLSIDSPDDPYSSLLQIRPLDRVRLNYQANARFPRGSAIEYQWRTTPIKDRVKPEYFNYDWAKILASHEGFADGVLRIQAPTEFIASDVWHDVIVRFNSANLELFVDGVLVDEEWPHGGLYQFRGSLLIGAGYLQGSLQTGIDLDVDHVAIWNRALTDGEVMELSGSQQDAASRASKMLGSKQGSLQYWLPQGINTYVGDCMPLYVDGEFHLFYLFDRHHHRSKWGMGAHQFAHASSKDLVHWEHHPMAIPITKQWECSIGTGTIVPLATEYHAIYIQHGRRCWFNDAPYAGDTVQASLSPDNLIFTKVAQPIVPWIYLRRKSGGAGDINPDIFPDVQDKGFYLSLSGEKIWTSTDLERWQELAGFDSIKDIGTGICSSYAEWNGWHYIVSSEGYRMSLEPLHSGWKFSQPKHPAVLEGLGVPQIARFHGNRCLMVGFLGGNTYAGEAVFRELIQRRDGTLGTKWPQEMLPPSGPQIELVFESTMSILKQDEVILTSKPETGFAIGSYIKVPQDVHIHARMKPSPKARIFGLCVRGLEAYNGGCEIKFDPAAGTVQFGSPINGRTAPTSKAVADGTDFSIGGIELPQDGFEIDVIVKDDFVDICINQERTMISRRSDRPRGNRLYFFSEGGELVITEINIRPLI